MHPNQKKEQFVNLLDATPKNSKREHMGQVMTNIAMWLQTKQKEEKSFHMYVATHKASMFKIMGA
jgi:hypothetical protein